MLKLRLLPAVCGVALLAATPAFAQGMSGQGSMSQDDGMTGSGRAHSRSMHHARSAESESSTIDQLNAQSLQAARQGQDFSGTSGMSSSGAAGMSGSSAGGGGAYGSPRGGVAPSMNPGMGAGSTGSMTR
jgi:hypothetical protein